MVGILFFMFFISPKTSISPWISFRLIELLIRKIESQFWFEILCVYNGKLFSSLIVHTKVSFSHTFGVISHCD
jgi:hypothetical protein